MKELANLPEGAFYDMLPAALVDMDTRHVLRALVDGYQERVSDQRFAIRKMSEAWDVSSVTPAVSSSKAYTQSFVVSSGSNWKTLMLQRYASTIERVTLNGVALTYAANIRAGKPLSYSTRNDLSATGVRTRIVFGNGTYGARLDTSDVVTVRYVVRAGYTVDLTYTVEGTGLRTRRVLDTNSRTPPDYLEDDLRAWAAAEAGVPIESVVSAVRGADAVRGVEVSTLPHVAATLGATLFHNNMLTPEEEADSLRRQMEGYFHWLRLKGTSASFDLLGRIMGFAAISMVPLWGRMSPRQPADVGDPANDDDFAYAPEVAPSAELPDPTRAYDPADTCDGVYYTWVSTAMSPNPDSPSYFPRVVNGLNPYVKLLLLDDAPAAPSSGYYTLVGGAQGLRAGVNLNKSLRIEALAPGKAFNGLRVEVRDRTLSIRGRLSRVKYRTSYADIVVAVDAEAFAERFGTTPVSDNQNALSAAIRADGPPRAPTGKPLQGGKAGSLVNYRTYAGPTERQHRLPAINALGLHAAKMLEEVRPATCVARRVTVGLLYSDDVGYAPYDNRTVLADGANDATAAERPAAVDVVDGVTAGGTVVRDGEDVIAWSEETTSKAVACSARVFVRVGSHDREQIVETSPTVEGRLLVNGRATGFINLINGHYEITVDAGHTGYIKWVTTSTEKVRDAPSTRIVSYQDRPEDEIL